MLTWLLLLPLPLPVLAGLDQTYGVRPDLLPKYVPLKSNTWRCLDGSKEIAWNAVNNDFCDCPDGSDEPGTSACANGVFYCHNTGHIGASIPSSRVNDGLCEPECCDGSDERPGVCRNTCKEIGDAFRKKREEELRIQRTGSKIRSTYIAFAQKEKKRLEKELDALSDQLEDQEKEVERLRGKWLARIHAYPMTTFLKDIAQRAESLTAAAIQLRKQSPLYENLMKHFYALKSLQREYKKLQTREKALGDILDTLRITYNPNYQDMAVLEAVRGWEQLAQLPHINDVGKGDGEVTSDEQSSETEEATEEEEVLEEGMWSSMDLELNLDPLLATDYESLLLAHDEHMDSSAETSALFNIAHYIPDAFISQFEDLKETFVSWLQKFGIIPAQSRPASDSSRAHQALTAAENELKKIQNQHDTGEDEYTKLTEKNYFGTRGEWKKLDGTCLETTSGEYIYEVCLFKEAKQKPVNGGATYSLGKFSSWNPNAQPGEPAYYQKQMYKHGARCWNGPERNVVLVLSCGTENKISSVVELEKCEYQITGTSPALCLPVEGDDKKGPSPRQEL
ncbi:hypothetical protein AMATHDRAFT_193421 [Amanita thiersii Skay4041]|uniref:Glucosidase 2 subunit beta n=1 Tax=Amanita thiersii Skay4041 TaxID=703135 RepID=A0A2A9NRM0_9AGAR|nr:hypothetical protein AMATHDRAFT_193421 [Amanita thiersii Skay4041]